MCYVSQTSKKVRVCKNYEERSASTHKKMKKGKKRRDAHSDEEKKNKALFSLPLCSRFALASLYYASFILVVEKIYTHKSDGERENDAMWEKKDDTLNDSIVLRVLFVYARGPSSST